MYYLIHHPDLFVLDLEEDPSILGKDIVVHLAVDFDEFFTKFQVFELDFALAKLVITNNIIIHHRDGQFHIVESFKVPNEILFVDWIAFVLFLGRFLGAHVLVKHHIVLFQFKLDVGITLLFVMRRE